MNPDTFEDTSSFFNLQTEFLQIASDWTSEYSNQKHEEQLWQKLEGEWTKQREEFMRNGWEQETVRGILYEEGLSIDNQSQHNLLISLKRLVRLEARDQRSECLLTLKLVVDKLSMDWQTLVDNSK